MIFHVMPGDSLVTEFNKLEIPGETIVCREAFVVGPVDAASSDEFWSARARFILSEYGDDEIVYHERVADELERLTDITAGDEVNLWFEYELFCSVNMWFCLSRLAGSGAVIYRVEPLTLSDDDRWKGFGLADLVGLRRYYDARNRFSAADIELGHELWNAYRRDDLGALIELGKTYSPCFPYLEEVCEAALERDTLPIDLITEIRSGGMTTFEDIFPEFTRRAGVYGYGDLQVKRLLDKLA